MHNNASSSAVLLHQKPPTYLFWLVNCLICADFSPDSDNMTFQWNRWSLKYEKPHDYFVFTKQYLNWWVVWIIVIVFISCLDSHSNGTHSPHHLPHHQWMLCDAAFLQILDELCMRTFSANVHSWVNYFFNLVLYSVVCHHSCFNK